MGMRRRTPPAPVRQAAKTALATVEVGRDFCVVKRAPANGQASETNCLSRRFWDAGSACASPAGLITHAVQSTASGTNPPMPGARRPLRSNAAVEPVDSRPGRIFPRRAFVWAVERASPDPEAVEGARCEIRTGSALEARHCLLVRRDGAQALRQGGIDAADDAERPCRPAP